MEINKMQMMRNISLIALFFISAFSVSYGQDSKETSKYLQKQFQIYLIRHNPYEYVRTQTAKSEILFLDVEISKAGKIDTIHILNELADMTFKKSVLFSLSKLKESFNFSKATPGTYPVLVSLLYGDDEAIFRTRSISWLMNFIQEKYRNFKQEPIVVVTSTSPPIIN